MTTYYIILYVLCFLAAICLLRDISGVPLWARWLVVIFSPVVFACCIVYTIIIAILNVLFNCDL